VDSWIAWHLTGAHIIEAGNASRTSLVDLATGQWSPALLEAFGVPTEVLPPIFASTHDHGACLPFAALPEGIRLTGILGDSHAALFAHRGWQPGVAKATFGTGSSVMAAVSGQGAAVSPDGLCRTVAWQLEGERATLAVEANILSSGATLAWLAGVLGTSSADLADHAAATSGGVQLVPAFNGLGAPWWDESARAVLVGMSLGTTTADLARAALDSIVLQVSDVVDEMARVGSRPARMVVDGGATANLGLMRILADLLDVPVLVSDLTELSAMGAAWAAGVGAGLWSLSDLEDMPRGYSHMTPGLSGIDVDALRSGWQDALSRSRALAPGTTREDSHHG
jgi:glycerol kinase